MSGVRRRWSHCPASGPCPPVVRRASRHEPTPIRLKKQVPASLTARRSCSAAAGREVLMRMKLVSWTGRRPGCVRTRLTILTVGVLFVFHSGSRAFAVTCAPVDHAPITIKADRDFTAANGVVSGDGSAVNPYLISNVKLNDLTPGNG